MKCPFLLLLHSFVFGFSYCAQAQIITNIAGNGTPGFYGDGGPATAAEFFGPADIIVDGGGNLYIADEDNFRVRKIIPSGTISTIAGIGTYGDGGDGGEATAATFSGPAGIALDGFGNLYIADENNNSIRKVNPLGIISTFAGTGFAGYSGDSLAATATKLYAPTGVAVDSSGNVYIADLGNNRIRKVTPLGTISTVAGIGSAGYSGDGGLAAAAQLNGPADVVLDSIGNMYISDRFNSCIRKVTSSGIITTIAGTGTSGYSGDGGMATLAQLHWPFHIAVNNGGNVYVADELNYCVRKITSSGIISTIAGNDTAGFSGDGGEATAARLGGPYGVAVDGDGNIYIADDGNERIRIIKCALDIAPVTGVTSVCVGATISLSDTTIGGTWSSGSASIATVDSATGLVDCISPGSALIMYSVSNSFCSLSAIDTINVDAFPNAGTIAGPDTLCTTMASIILTDTVTGGVWSRSNASATVAGGVVSEITTGRDTIYYMLTNSCGIDTATHVVSIVNCPAGVNTFPRLPEAAVEVHPNPNNGTFTVTVVSAKDEPADVVITNMVGENVKRVTTTSNEPVSITLNVPAGVYFLTATTAHYQWNTKIVVQ